MFLNNLAISWHLLGNSGDYLAVSKTSQMGTDEALKAQKPQERRTKGAMGT